MCLEALINILHKKWGRYTYILFTLIIISIKPNLFQFMINTLRLSRREGKISTGCFVVQANKQIMRKVLNTDIYKIILYIRIFESYSTFYIYNIIFFTFARFIIDWSSLINFLTFELQKLQTVFKFYLKVFIIWIRNIL